MSKQLTYDSFSLLGGEEHIWVKENKEKWIDLILYINRLIIFDRRKIAYPQKFLSRMSQDI